METTLKKHWITALGILFIFLGFLYFLKMAIDQNWIPPVVRAVTGIVTGVSCMFMGYIFFRKEKKITSEITAGFGISLVFATFAYTSFSSSIHWSANSLFICVLSLTGLFAWASYVYDLRILLFISILGGLLSPVILKAGEQQVFSLFLYLTVLNIAALFISVYKGWNEIRIMSFVVTVINYITYYVLFSPVNWGKPFFYISSLFLVYMIGSLVASIIQKDRFIGLNMYLGLINAINYVFWSIFIFNNFNISYTYATLISGLIFMVTGSFIFFSSDKSLLPALTYFGLGIVLLAVSGGDMKFFSTIGINYVMSSAVWMFLLGVLFVAGKVAKKEGLKYISAAGWAILLIYWFSVAWNVKWVKWFGVPYIPFINPGAFIWIGLATMGFIYSVAVEKKDRILSTAFAIISHVVMGGLFTVQIKNLWEAYTISAMPLQLALSLSWSVYALSLFIWGAYKQSVIFRVFGSAVLIFASAKVLIFDLSGNANIYKVLSLIVMGGVILLISYIYQRWTPKKEENKGDEQIVG